MGKFQEINGCKYEFVKEIPSDTAVTGWHVRIDTENYVVLYSPKPLHRVSAYQSTRLGRILDLSNQIFVLESKNIQDGVDELIKITAAKKYV